MMKQMAEARLATGLFGKGTCEKGGECDFDYLFVSILLSWHIIIV